jgi:hypothetical protein
MPVTKQTYAINAGFTGASVVTALRSALIDAGLMTEWHDSFSQSGNRNFRVLRIQHDAAKAYGTNFYVFVCDDSGISVSMATGGWKETGTAPINIPTGVQYLDWHTLPVDTTANANSQQATYIFNYSTTSDLYLHRFTSGLDAKQSWFVFSQPSSLTRSAPFTILHKDTTLHSWLDLAKGCISGFSMAKTAVVLRSGITTFSIEENLRRCLSIGAALKGATSANAGSGSYHGAKINSYSYFGVGSQNDLYPSNFPDNFRGASNGVGAGTPLPVGRNYNNPEYTTDYVPICTNLPWCYWTPTRLANDFGIYMHYAANDIAFGDRFVVQSAINEWEVLSFANNLNLTDGASATFLARII